MKLQFHSTFLLVGVTVLLSVRSTQSPQSGCNLPPECTTGVIPLNPSTDVAVVAPFFTTEDWTFWRQIVHIHRNQWSGPAWYSIRNATAFSQYGILFPSGESVMNSNYDDGNFIRQLGSNPTLGTYRVTVDVRNQDNTIRGSKDFNFVIVPDEGIYVLRTPITMRQGSSDSTIVYFFQYGYKSGAQWQWPKFQDPVQLQALDEPGNVSFSPFTPIAPPPLDNNFDAPIRQSTMFITMPANAGVGRHLIRVLGTSQPTGEQRETTVEVDVLGTQPPLSVSPDYIVTTQNSPGVSSVTANRGSCSDPVTLLSTPSYPLTFAPNPIPGNSTTSTLTVPSLATTTYRPDDVPHL